MTTPHTPGPWGLMEGARHCDLILTGPSQQQIANLHSIHDGIERKESPDAALIAAAPDLYSALQGLIEAILPCEAPAGRKAATLAALDAARAAIAKAEGRDA